MTTITAGQAVEFHMGVDDADPQPATVVAVFPNGLCDVEVLGHEDDEPTIAHGLVLGDEETTCPHVRFAS